MCRLVGVTLSLDCSCFLLWYAFRTLSCFSFVFFLNVKSEGTYSVLRGSFDFLPTNYIYKTNKAIDEMNEVDHVTNGNMLINFTKN